MISILEHLSTPLVQAPMAGVSNPDLVAAVCNAGGLGFLAAGYQSSDAMAEQIHRTRQLTERPFGINLFVPQPDVSDARALAIEQYADEIAAIAAQYDVPAGDPHYDDDGFAAKIESLVADPVAIVTFTFGAVDPTVVQRLQAVGTEIGFTVTNVDEAQRAAQLGANLLVAQGAGAGGHRGIWDMGAVPNDTDTPALVTDILASIDLPVIGAGGIGDAADVQQLLDLGCMAVAAGTAFVAADESPASPAWKHALTSDQFAHTVTTRAFSGRVARALPNQFIHQAGPAAPAAYPQLHHLTRPIRIAAARANDPNGLAMWAGTGFRHAVSRSAAQIVADLTPATTPGGDR